MSDLAINVDSAFTKWVVQAGLLAEPLVLIDVGVQGGENDRWKALGDHLVVHGFDPIESVIEGLKQKNSGRPNKHYHWMAVGNTDGEQTFYFNAANPTASSMYSQGAHRLGEAPVEQPVQVPIRRLDSLRAQGVIPSADFLKVDVEGFEKEVMLGARELMRSGLLGLHAESNFSVSPTYPKSHFGTLAEMALESNLLVYDIAFNRIPRASFQKALMRKGMPPVTDQESVGKPATLDILFCRDLIDEVDQPKHYPSPCLPFSVDQLIKTMIICELHGLNDIACDTAERFADRLGARLDVERATWLLANPDCRLDLLAYYRQNIRAFENSTSWRVTAPLRWLKNTMMGRGEK